MQAALDRSSNPCFRTDKTAAFAAGIGVAVRQFVSDDLPIQSAGVLPTPMLFGVYRAVERIAEGGMGMIFRAEDARGGPPVAIKTVRSAREEDAAAIGREIVTLSRLPRHPGIVRLHGYGVQRGGPWIALELLDGRTLAEELSGYWPENVRFR